jgi:hypothetical protein
MFTFISDLRNSICVVNRMHVVAQDLYIVKYDRKYLKKEVRTE